MSLEEKIEKDLTQAMKARAADTVSTLRMLKAACGNAQIQKKKNALEDGEVIEIIQKQHKQRQESIESFEKAGRQELADKEKREMAILNAYLPAQLSESEIRAIVQSVIAKVGAQSKADMGKLMKALMPEVKGKADGQKVNRIVSELLP